MKRIAALDRNKRYFNVPFARQKSMFESFKPAD